CVSPLSFDLTSTPPRPLRPYHAFPLFSQILVLLMLRSPPCFTLFPYTTLFRSSFLDLSLADGLRTFFLRVKAYCRSGKHSGLLRDSRRLCHPGIRGQIPPHNGQAAQRAVGIVQGPDDLGIRRIRIFVSRQIFSNRKSVVQ